ncbi:MAG: TrmH family RNA methyltransferase [Thermoanaerobaculia bacterium]
MKTITSRQNEIFKRVREALREHRQEIVIEGPKQVADAIATGWKPISLIYRSEIADHGSQAVAFSSQLFEALAETKSPQNVIGLFERPAFTLKDVFKRKDTIVVALDGVQDPGNVGTIVRLAAAFDCGGVALLRGCADPYSPKSIRASAGAVLFVPIVKTTSAGLIGTRLPMFAADARGAVSEPPPKAAIIVFGSEGGGLSEEIRSAATPIAVRMSPRVESLNVAASAAILLSRSYEARTHAR